MDCANKNQASALLRNKFVIIIGDSIQRSVYKDLVLLLETGSYLTVTQLKLKGEMTFENDCLLEGGLLSQPNNGEYREVRQYCRDHHLIRFYYTTFIYSSYVESILAGIENGVKPDIIILNSCVWDLSRFNRSWVSKYDEHLRKMLTNLKKVLPPECVVMWHTSMPVSGNVVGGYFLPQLARQFPMLCHEAIEANFYSGMAATSYGMNVVDVHFHAHKTEQLVEDGVSEIALAHRHISCLIIECVARSWGVEDYKQHSWFHPNKRATQAQQVPAPTAQPIDYSLRSMPRHVTSMPLNLSLSAGINPYPTGAAAHPSWRQPGPLYPQPSCEAPGLYLPMNIPRYMQPYVQQVYPNFDMRALDRSGIAGTSMGTGSSPHPVQPSMVAQQEKGSKKKPTNKQVPPAD